MQCPQHTEQQVIDWVLRLQNQVPLWGQIPYSTAVLVGESPLLQKDGKNSLLMKTDGITLSGRKTWIEEKDQRNQTKVLRRTADLLRERIQGKIKGDSNFKEGNGTQDNITRGIFTAMIRIEWVFSFCCGFIPTSPSDLNTSYLLNTIAQQHSTHVVAPLLRSPNSPVGHSYFKTLWMLSQRSWEKIQTQNSNVVSTEYTQFLYCITVKKNPKSTMGIQL